MFGANEPLTGKRFVEETKFKKKTDLVLFINEIASHYKNAKKISLVMDNFNTHSPCAFYEAFEPKVAKQLLDRFEFIFTPKRGS